MASQHWGCLCPGRALPELPRGGRDSLGLSVVTVARPWPPRPGFGAAVGTGDGTVLPLVSLLDLTEDGSNPQTRQPGECPLCLGTGRRGPARPLNFGSRAPSFSVFGERAPPSCTFPRNDMTQKAALAGRCRPRGAPMPFRHLPASTPPCAAPWQRWPVSSQGGHGHGHMLLPGWGSKCKHGPGHTTHGPTGRPSGHLQPRQCRSPAFCPRLQESKSTSQIFENLKN